MGLQSELFKGDMKLEAAAVSDPAHVVPGTVGPQVAKIQQALIDLDSAKITADGKYGPGTADAVKAFKEKRKILNYLGKIDDIVGKKTMTALDAEMVALETQRKRSGKLRLGFALPDIQWQDFVIYFQGGEPEMDLPDDEVFDPKSSPAYIATRRAMWRLGYRTNKIGSAFAQRSLNDVERRVKDGKAGGQLGRIYIFGASAGGRLAITCAERLMAAGFPLRFVAVTDAALYDDGSISVPRFPTDRTPTFLRARVSADIKLNYYQTSGNSIKLGRGRLHWSSGMEDEVHGKVAGFENGDGDLTAAVNSQAGKSPSDLQKHIVCNRIALTMIRAKINADLNSCPFP